MNAEKVLRLEPIKYGHKLIDTGYIIGTRKYMWMAKRNQSPLWAKQDNEFVGEVLYKKSAPKIFYIPANVLQKGSRLVIFDSSVDGEPKTYIIAEVNKFSFVVKNPEQEFSDIPF
ncbi:MAG TPA: hypothetical protein ENH82_01120 [bacterium]|nr:hypothetical protein [bacterium]